MRRLIEQSHLDLCCLQKLFLSHVAVKELTLSTLGKNFGRRHIDIFYIFSHGTGFDVSCKLICMKCQILFSGKNKKNINKLSSVVYAREW